jgi:hypothetical protein
VDGTERHIVVSVEQGWFSTAYALTIDGEVMPLAPVK